MKALVVGGTGPTGPYIVAGLLARGYEVAILHRGTHEVAEIPPEVEHIHVDPHFRETLDAGLAGRSFDLVVAAYGRIRIVAEALIGKTPRLIAIGGAPACRGLLEPQTTTPPGLPIPTAEDAPRIGSDEENHFGWMARQTEDSILAAHAAGHYNATMLRYPLFVYGPNALGSFEWPIIRRVQDKRRQIVLPDGGLTIKSGGYAQNMAHAVLLAVDQPDAAAGKIYHCSDEQLVSVGQWVQLIAGAMDWEFEICGVPDAFAHTTRELLPAFATSHHQVLDISRIKQELGYRDLLPVTAAVPLSVRWLLQHRPQGKPDGELHYAVEDRLLAIYNDAYARMEAIPFAATRLHHIYPHPKQPGQERDHRQR